MVEDKAQEAEPVVVFRAMGDMEADIVKGLLESNGIPCSLTTRHVTHTPFPLTMDGAGEVRITVPAQLAEEARSIIEAYREQPDVRNLKGSTGEGQGD